MKFETRTTRTEAPTENIEQVIVQFPLNPREYIPTAGPSFTNTQAFIIEATYEGAHFLAEEGENPQFDVWSKRWSNLVTYAFSNKTLDEIAASKGVTRQSIHQSNKSALMQLRNAASEELRDKYSEDMLTMKKPIVTGKVYPVHKEREKRAAEVIKLASEGMSVAEMKIMGTDIDAIYRAREVLDRHGIGISQIQPNYDYRKRISVLLDKSATLNEKTAVLSNYYHNRIPERYKDYIVNLSSLIREAGLSIKNRVRLTDIAGVLKNEGIPVGISEYMYQGHILRSGHVAKVDRQKALTILRTHNAFEKARMPSIIDVSGKASELPLTTAVSKKDIQGIKQIIGVKSFIKLRKKGLSLVDILDDDCPAPLFQQVSTGQYLYYPKDGDALKEYLTRKINKVLE